MYVADYLQKNEIERKMSIFEENESHSDEAKILFAISTGLANKITSSFCKSG